MVVPTQKQETQCKSGNNGPKNHRSSGWATSASPAAVSLYAVCVSIAWLVGNVSAQSMVRNMNVFRVSHTKTRAHIARERYGMDFSIIRRRVGEARVPKRSESDPIEN